VKTLRKIGLKRKTCIQSKNILFMLKKNITISQNRINLTYSVDSQPGDKSTDAESKSNIITSCRCHLLHNITAVSMRLPPNYIITTKISLLFPTVYCAHTVLPQNRLNLIPLYYDITYYIPLSHAAEGSIRIYYLLLV